MRLNLTFAFLIATLTFTTPSYGDWKFIGISKNGDTLYLDVNRIRKDNGLIYFWDLEDYIKPDDDLSLSSITFRRGDCNIMKFNYLSISAFDQPMGRGKRIYTANFNDEDWKYPPPGSLGEFVLETACDFSNM